MREPLELVRFKVYDDGYQAFVSELQKSMDVVEFETTWAAGAAMSPEEAIAYAQRGRGERRRLTTGWGSLTPTELDVVRLVAEAAP
jgi:hypothetical protein